MFDLNSCYAQLHRGADIADDSTAVGTTLRKPASETEHCTDLSEVLPQRCWPGASTNVSDQCLKLESTSHHCIVVVAGRKCSSKH